MTPNLMPLLCMRDVISPNQQARKVWNRTYRAGKFKQKANSNRRLAKRRRFRFATVKFPKPLMDRARTRTSLKEPHLPCISKVASHRSFKDAMDWGLCGHLTRGAAMPLAACSW